MIYVYNTRNRWMGGLDIFKLKKALDKVLHRRLLWKLEYMGGLKGTWTKIDGRLPERKKNENNSKGWKIRMKENSTWSTIGISFGPNNVYSICKWRNRRSKQFYKLVRRLIKIPKENKKPKDCEELQNDINKIYEWNTTWEMEFNTNKMPCIGNGKEWNGIHMDIYVRTKYHINRKRKLITYQRNVLIKYLATHLRY